MLASSVPTFDVRILGTDRAQLGDLEFYVHLLSSEPTEYSLYEALAMGVPVMLPRPLPDSFEHAAGYSSAQELVDTITSLWASEQIYSQQSANARRFAAAHCSTEALSRRLRAYQ